MTYQSNKKPTIQKKYQNGTVFCWAATSGHGSCLEV